MNKPKAKGTAFETAVVRYCQANGFEQAERRALAGNMDRGDILLCPDVIVECKAYAKPTTGQYIEWLEETRIERRNANASIGMLVVKRANMSIALSWAVFAGAQGEPVFRYLSDALIMLRTGGYGSELDPS